MIDLGKIKQGERGTLTIPWEFPDSLTSPASISGGVVTAVMENLDTGDVTAVTGTLTATAATAATWELSAGDSGTYGTYFVTFQAIVGGVTTYTLNAKLEIEENPAATASQNPALVSVPVADAAWLTAGLAAGGAATEDNLASFSATGIPEDSGVAKTAVGNATKLQSRTLVNTAPSDGQAIVWDAGNSQWEPGDVAGGASDVGDLTTTGLTSTNMLRVAAAGGLEERTSAEVLGDIGAEASGAAATVQGNLDTHTGNTSNPHTVTAAQVGAYATGDFSAAPTAAEPLKADGSGKLRLAGIGVGGAPGSSHLINVVGNSASITVGVSLTDQRVGYTRQWIMKAADGDYSWIDVTASNAIRIYIKGNTGLVGIGETNPQGQIHAKSSGAAVIGAVVQAAVSQTANVQEWRNGSAGVMSAIAKNGAWKPPQLADADAENGTVYYSTDAAKLVFKDYGGSVNNLY